VQVSDPSGKPVHNLKLATRGDGSTGSPTTDTGKTRIRLALGTKPNSPVSLMILPDSRNLVFLSPWDGNVRVPPFENESQNFVPIVVVTHSQKSLLENPDELKLVVRETIKATRTEKDPIARHETLAAFSQQIGFDPLDVSNAARSLGQTPSVEDKQLSKDFSEAFPFDFSISGEVAALFEKQFAVSAFQVPVAILHVGAVHPEHADCEANLSARLNGIKPGIPGLIVVEPPNLCKSRPAEVGATEDVPWRQWFDRHALNTSCKVVGFVRLFNEHRVSASKGIGDNEGSSNPQHVVEIHPAMSIYCGNDTLDLSKGVRGITAMHFATAATTELCIRNYKISARWSTERDEIQFKLEQPRCPNWAKMHIYEVFQVKENSNGHKLQVSGSPGTADEAQTLTFYSLKGSAFDDAVIAGRRQFSDLQTLLTIDPAKVTAIARAKSREWGYLRDPIAFVVFGELGDDQDSDK
jgi:hypothetical protein